MNFAEFQLVAQGVDWRSFPGAYGETFNPAACLLAVASSDEDEAREAAGLLMGHVCHQGVLEESAVPAAGLLLQLTNVCAGPNAALALDAILWLAQSSWVQPRHFGFLPRRREPSSTGEAAKNSAAAAAYDVCSGQVAAVLLAHVQVLVQLLKAEDERVRALAARLISILQSGDARTLQALSRAHALEPDRTVKAGMLLSLAVVARDSQIDLGGLKESIGHGLDGILACIGRIVLHPPTWRELPLDVIAEGLRWPRLAGELFPWCDGSVAGLMSEALLLTKERSEPVAGLLVHALRHWRARVPQAEEQYQEWPDLEIVGERAVEAMLGQFFGQPQPLSRDALDVQQRRFLHELAAFAPEVPGFYGLRAAGIRSPRSDLLLLSTH